MGKMIEVVVNNYGYSKEYVEILYDGIIRNLPEGFPGKFICYTNDQEIYSEGIEKRVASGQIIPSVKTLLLPLNICIVGPLDEIVQLDNQIIDLNVIKEKFPHLIYDYDGSEPKGSIIVFKDKMPHECNGWVKNLWKRGGSLVSSWKVVGNVSDAVITANIEHALSLDVEILADQYRFPSNNKLLIVGGGPSLEEDLTNISLMQKGGAIVWALNNTFRYLFDHGIEANAHIMLDAREENKYFVPLETPAVLLYSAQCHPHVLDKGIKAGKLILWMPSVEGIIDLLKLHKKRAAIVSGGSSVGLKALGLAQLFGFKNIHLFGFDSSYRDEKNHAYSQRLNENERIVDVTVNDRKFRCAPWMATQVEEFKQSLSTFLNVGMAISVHGDGLLPYVASIINLPPEIINYDLSRSPASWDFVTWLFNVMIYRKSPFKLHFKKGPDHGFRSGDPIIVFTHQKQMLLDNVCRAAMKLFGIIETNTEGTDLEIPYTARPAVEAYKNGDTLPLMQEDPVAKEWAQQYRDFIVITLREADYWIGRNSDLKAWTKFVREHLSHEKVVFVRDTSKANESLDEFSICSEASLDILKRYSLYKTAKLNFFVSNGPATLVYFDPAIPYINFIKKPPGYEVHTDKWWLRFVGLGLGENWPWATNQQMMVNKEDSFDNIVEAYNNLLQQNRSNDIDKPSDNKVKVA